MQRLALFGATGSIGRSTLAVVASHPERYAVHALVARSNVDLLLEQIQQFHPKFVGVADPKAADKLRQALAGKPFAPTVVSDELEITALAAAPEVNVVVAAIVGAAGLASSLAAAQAGKRLLLANKESLVMSGALLMDAVRKNGAELLPVDSEHNAIFQCLPPASAAESNGVAELILTASGGPFRTWPASVFDEITPEQACAHPNWSMGRKISVDSATLMNKGLEVIEAHWLFGMPASRISVAVHPQSVVHSMVRFNDGSVLAQMGRPDMRTPIAHALAWPERIDSGVEPLDLFALGPLEFEPPDTERFPCLQLAYDALEAGGYAPAALNAANEVAVAAFLEGKIRFTDIPRVVSSVLSTTPSGSVCSLEELLAVDAQARQQAQDEISRLR
ncbi:MAG TPA: 1-deoxy-D-xylulose-5-phosphate reductoisomerase [Halothiobacillus sp.]|nr:1-deoxy-D-xylulose-5-phosphate reductoisomerase [Halothiobacillus sp.]